MLYGEKMVPNNQQGVSVGDGSIWNGDHEWNYCRLAGPGYALNDNSTSTHRLGRGVFGSSHAGGIVNFLFADGNTRGLSEETDTVTLGYLSNRADGNSVVVP
ncbi:MAG: hypothetical protein QM811_17165 [Pirellulales bacterium]